MKKLFLVLACASLSLMGANAQEKLVKSVEKDIKVASPDYKAARTKLKPALTDETSKNLAETWYVAGKLEFSMYDDMLGKRSINPQSVDPKVMGIALIDGYDYFVKALPLDSVPEIDKKTGEPKKDKKTGEVKIKTKYSKEILNVLVGHYNDYSQAGSDLYDAKDYNNAAKAWDIFASMPKAKFLGKQAPVVEDTIIGMIRYYQALALWLDNNPKDAIAAFEQARENGYNKKDVYDYAISCAAQIKDDKTIAAIAKEAMPLYGKEDSQYVRILINSYLNEQNYAEANKILDQAIADNPQNSEFCNLKGILLENQSSIEEAFPYFQKAVELDPTSSKAQFDLGRYYFNKAVKLRDEKVDLTGVALAKLVNPLYEQALPYLEKAYELDKENVDAKNALRNIYYQLGDEAKLEAIEKN